MLAAEGISVRVIDIHTIKPLDREIVLKAARECGVIVTTEEHNVMAGFGSAVAEVAGKVQKSVFSALHDMTGFDVKAVNVHVGGICFE